MHLKNLILRERSQTFPLPKPYTCKIISEVNGVTVMEIRSVAASGEQELRERKGSSSALCFDAHLLRLMGQYAEDLSISSCVNSTSIKNRKLLEEGGGRAQT